MLSSLPSMLWGEAGPLGVVKRIHMEGKMILGWSQIKQQKLSLDHFQPSLDKGPFENMFETIDPIPS